MSELDPRTKTRRGHPGTSYAAAASVTGVRQSQQDILNILRECGPMTDVKIREEHTRRVAAGQAKKQSSSGLRARRSELVEEHGLVVDSGRKEKLESGSYAIVWAAGNGTPRENKQERKMEDTMQLNPEKAKTIVIQAKKDSMYEGSVPEDEKALITTATEIITMAQEAWDQLVRGPEVMTILKLAASDIGDSKNGNVAPEVEQGEAPDQPNDDSGSEQVDEPTPPAEPQSESPHPVDPGADDFSGEETEDDDGGEIDPGAERAEQKIDTPDYDNTLILSRKEPWDGYKEAKVPEIKETLFTVGEGGVESPDEVLAHVKIFESHNKNRQRVLAAVEEAIEKRKARNEEAPQGDDPQPVEVPASEDQQPTPEVERPPQDPESERGGPASGDSEGQDDEGGTDREEGRAEGEPVPADAPSEPVGEADAPQPEAEGGNDSEAPEEDEGDYGELIEAVEEQLQRERLHIPEPPTEKAPEIPWDWTQMTDAELHKLHGVFSAFAYRVSYLLAREERIALHCKQAADELSRDLLASAAKYDAHGKEIKVTFLDAEIASDPNVKKYRKRQHKHEMFASGYRSERESYMKLVEALSRQETMRHNEWERSGQRRR